MTPETFARAFAVAFATQDSTAMAKLLASDATVLTLTGTTTESSEAARQALAAEFIGIFAQARLVTGKGRVRVLGPEVSLVTQRYVVTNALDEAGAELPRFAALLIAVLQATQGNWLAVSLTFSAIS